MILHKRPQRVATEFAQRSARPIPVVTFGDTRFVDNRNIATDLAHNQVGSFDSARQRTREEVRHSRILERASDGYSLFAPGGIQMNIRQPTSQHAAGICSSTAMSHQQHSRHAPNPTLANE